MSEQATNVNAETKPATPITQRPWFKTSLKVVKETSKYVGSAAAGVAGVLVFQHFAASE